MQFRSTKVQAALTGAALLAGTALVTPSYAASTLSAQWFDLSAANPDTNLDIPGVVTGMVNSALGPNGLPVRSAFSAGATGSMHINDIDPMTNEVLWWTPHSTVTSDSGYPSS